MTPNAVSDQNTQSPYKGKYCIIRTSVAGVHAGVLLSQLGDTVRLIDSRRIWYWDGAASLSQLARDGVSKPENCKFAVPLEDITILGVIEIIPCTKKAEKNIRAVANWER